MDVSDLHFGCLPLFIIQTLTIFYIYLTPYMCSEPFSASNLKIVRVHILKQIGFQFKHQIFGFHLIPFASKFIKDNFLKRPKKHLQNFSSALLEIYIIKGLISSLFEIFRLSNASQTHISRLILNLQNFSFERT